MTLAATLVKKEIFNAFLGEDLNSALMHGPTFMGNPLACAAANASLDLFEKNNYEEKVSNIEKNLKIELEKCRKYKAVKDVRVLGAVGVIEVDLQYKEIYELRKKFINAGVFLRPFGNCIYVMQPLTISKLELKKITDGINKILN